VRSFLRARGIAVPEGSPDDPPQRDTVHGLGRRKNALFLQRLADEGAQVFRSTLDLIRALRAAGIRTAVVSASRNAREVLESVHALELFDVKVDGLDALRAGWRGKPAPDTFLAAARQLGVEPRRAVLVEDAQAGVQAGRAGGFGLVIGVDRADQAESLLAHGGDVVVRDLSEVSVAADDDLDSAFDALPRIAASIGRRRLALFLDYDGTLTPIVERPQLAVLSEAMRSVLRQLARPCVLAVISGRDLEDVRQRVGLDGICYAGSHGFDIAAPGLATHAPPQAAAAVPEFDDAEAFLRERLQAIPGVLLERKRYGLAVHFRMADPGREHEVESAVDAALARSTRLRKTHGKKVFELLPDIDWHKGAALDHLRNVLNRRREDTLSIYIGDDLTDEDAFKALDGGDIGILVAPAPRPSAATHRLADPDDVMRFLQALAQHLEPQR
jgi:alpha,alpha-trehalase